MGTIASGLLRNRFRLVLNSGIEAPGFTFDVNRMPGAEIDQGTGVGVGAFWDGDNDAFHDQFHVPKISGQLEYSWKRANWTPGQPYLVAGIGDNDDLELSGIEASTDQTSWSPIIEPGVFFDLNTPYYLYSQNAIEEVIPGSGIAYVTSPVPAEFKPISLATYHVDPWGRARPYELFRQKHSFTATAEAPESLTPTVDSDPTLYEPRYTNIRWQDVDTTNFEFMYDPYAPGVVMNQTITSNVHAILNRVPWSQTYFQLPLVPVIELSGVPVFTVHEDLVQASGSMATPTLAAYSMANLTVTQSGYVRVSGSWDEVSGMVPVYPAPTGWPASGMLVIDDGDFRQELLEYASISGIYFSGLTRSNPTIHRDGAQVRLYISGAAFDGTQISGLPAGDFLAQYDVSGLPTTLNLKTGLLQVEPLSGIHRVEMDVNYIRGVLLCYEPSGVEDVYRASGLNISPLAHGIEHGLLWASMFPLRPAKIELTASRGKNDDGTVGPIFAGNDFMVLEAKVLTNHGAPIPNETVTLVLEDPTNAGLVNAVDPEPAPVTRTTDGTGIARFVYTPPDTIQGMGYFVSSGNLSGSGLQLHSTAPIEEFWSSGLGYRCLLFAVNNDDSYLPFESSSGIFEFSADGRFELVTMLSGTSSTGFHIWKAVEPVAFLDSDGSIVTASGSRVSTVVFPSGSIPVEDEISAYFISVERRLSVGAMIPEANVASQSLEVVVGIPPFMTGEFLFGPIDDPDTSSFDSLAYLTINPFEERDPEISRSDPRTLGNVFMVQGSAQNLLRNKFYIGIDYDTLQETQTGRAEMRKIHCFRNRFIVEI